MGADSARQAAVFLDRDGTVIEDAEYLRSPDQVVMLPGAVKALKALQDAGFLLIMVTNQSGVGRGMFTLQEVERVHVHLKELLGQEGVRLDAIYVAPEAPGQPVHGRKPEPTFLFEARDALGIDLARSYMVGDKAADVECGRRAGLVESILVRTGKGAGTEAAMQARGDQVIVVDDLEAAARWILARGKVR